MNMKVCSVSHSLKHTLSVDSTHKCEHCMYVCLYITYMNMCVCVCVCARVHMYACVHMHVHT